VGMGYRTTNDREINNNLLLATIDEGRNVFLMAESEVEVIQNVCE
jgi:hypothetical protein